MSAGAKKVDYRTDNQDSTDPLRIKAKPKEREKETKRREKYIRGAVLEWLASNNHIGKLEFVAGQKIRDLCNQSGGQVRSIDFTIEQVDGGGASRDWLMVGTTGAQKTLCELACMLGPDATFVIFHVAGLGYTIKAVALEFEEDEQRLKDGNPSRRAQDYVRMLLRYGLSLCTFHLGLATTAPDASRKPMSKRIQFWRDASLGKTSDGWRFGTVEVNSRG